MVKGIVLFVYLMVIVASMRKSTVGEGVYTVVVDVGSFAVDFGEDAVRKYS